MPATLIERFKRQELSVFNSAMETLVAARTAELRKELALVVAQKQELELALQRKNQGQSQLETALSDAQLLHEISAMLIDENSIGELYQKLVEAATVIMRSEFGSMQRYDPTKGALQLIAQHGLDEEAVAYWQWVKPGRATTCGKALEVGERVIVSDFEACEFISGSEDLIAFRKAGVRAAQSTPLLTRNGRLVGMITTHWTSKQLPSARDLRLLDIIARQAADLIERNISAEALRNQAERLLEADRYKDEFLATLAHELRNPLAPIKNGLTLLRIGKPEQAPRVVDMMERQLGHMVRLVDDLLDVSRISSGKVNLKHERVMLKAVIDIAVEASHPLIQANEHNFKLAIPEADVWLYADATRIAQIVSNLLHNAAKYTPVGGHIELAAEVAGGDVLIHVVDTGIGIPAAMLPQIFKLFAQVDGSAERSRGGLGVGLALSKQLAEMHRGRIDVVSGGDKLGSTFTLVLPIAQAPGAAVMSAAAAAHTPSDERSLRILIVDDNVDAAETLGALMEEVGHSICVVVDSTKALAGALNFVPDVVILDLGMPYLDGFAVARQLRSEPGLGGVYIAALSGWGTDDDRRRTREAGIDHHMVKPVKLVEIVDMLSLVSAGNAAIASPR
ncbi:hybrid sensor histidine kinase/response regulator [Duganella levis]|uniref:histidine kinase n=1 Tax=Duganella levis TaxID=2692169 RepID=A0ABW9W5F2_9BURK|nr:ATP-binding protein [Duganella levis]MYN29193.1 response regulator [Duganella levis]